MSAREQSFSLALLSCFTMDWKAYEVEVFDALSAHHINDTIIKNHKVRGIYSKRSRQIDVYINQKINNSDYVTIVDSKNYNKKINVKTVESFISMIDDVGADYGIMISEKGFTKSALNRAFNNPKNIELDVYNFAEITHHLQAEGAIPYTGGNAALILAPFSWIVDATRRPGSICYLYKKGLTIEEALASGEFAYINFWGTEKTPMTVEELAANQEQFIAQVDIIENSQLFQTEHTLGLDAQIRVTKIKGSQLIEMAGYIKFEDFIFFCILHTVEIFHKRNFRKLQLLLRNILPMKIQDNKAT
jgi:hypothetical protein